MSFCDSLAGRYKNVVAKFTDKQQHDVAIVEKVNNKYFVTFNYLTCPCSGANFPTLEEAISNIKRLRKSAMICNSICNHCISGCAGTHEMVYTGCIYRKTA